MRTYQKFDLPLALGTEKLPNGTLLLAGENWMLEPIVDSSNQLKYRRPGRVGRAISELRIAAAQIVQDPKLVENIPTDLDQELRDLLDKHQMYVAVPEANKFIQSATAPVVELDALSAAGEDGTKGLLVSGLGAIGLIEPNEGRTLYVASHYRPPDSHYVPYIP